MRSAALVLALMASVATAFVSRTLPMQHRTPRVARNSQPTMALPINLEGKVAFVAGVADSNGYGAWRRVSLLSPCPAS